MYTVPSFVDPSFLVIAIVAHPFRIVLPVEVWATAYLLTTLSSVLPLRISSVNLGVLGDWLLILRLRLHVQHLD